MQTRLVGYLTWAPTRRISGGIWGRIEALAGLVAENPGMRVPGAWDGFELAVRAVLGQQLTAVDSPTLVKRMVETYGQAVGLHIPGLSRLFPRPEVLAQANLWDLGVPGDIGARRLAMSLARAQC